MVLVLGLSDERSFACTAQDSFPSGRQDDPAAEQANVTIVTLWVLPDDGTTLGARFMSPPRQHTQGIPMCTDTASRLTAGASLTTVRCSL